MKPTLKYLLPYCFVYLLAACGSQDGVNTDIAGVNIALDAPKTVATQATETTTVGTSPKRDLLANLALAYPGGELLADRAAAAAEQLAQNPAVLKFNASSAVTPQISPQSGAIQPQAATSYTFGLYAPVQRAQNTTLFGSYFYSIYPTEMANALASNPNWNLEGTAFHASLGINPGLAPVYRFRNLLNGSYLYTINDAEKDNIIANYSTTFLLEGVAWYASPVPVTGFSPLYRFRNLTNGTYLFSAYENEKDAIVANYAGIFLLEGISYYVRQAAPSEIALFAGSGMFGAANGTRAAASFRFITGIVHDRAGNMFVTDSDNHTIRKITPSGVVSTFAGAAGVLGSTNGAATVARFSYPWGITIDSLGNFFVTEQGSHTIRKITPAGVVSLFAGSPGVTGATNATGSAARFFGPTGLTIDGANNLYVADTDNSTIRKITSAGSVTTVAGLALSRGNANGTRAAARFDIPFGVTSDTAGTLYVADTRNNSVRKVTPAGVVSTLAGSATSVAGTGVNARFDSPIGITIDSANNLYVCNLYNATVRKITPDAVVSTLAGIAGDDRPFTEAALPAAIGKLAYSVDIYGGQLFIGTDTRVLRVIGLP